MALIEIGSTKQLFIDDHLIESMTNTEPRLNPALKVDDNPVLRPERPWEGNSITIGGALSRGAFFDEEEGIFKMFYEAVRMAPRVVDGEIVSVETQPRVACFATSEDGIHWDRPSLGLVEYDGSTKNNIIPDDKYLPYIFYDSHEDDPARRIKGFKRTGDTQTPGMTIDLFFSPNGFDWTPYENNPVVDTRPRYGRWGPTMFMGWDDIRQVYAVHMENALHRRSAIGKRLIGRSESPDLYEWSDPETILVPDERDPSDTEFYALPAITYEGWYVGMLWVYNTTSTTHYPEAVFSRDGIHYQRNFRQPFIQRGGRRVEFDYNSIYAGVPIVHGDMIHTYYNGINWRSPEALMELGDRGVGAIGLGVTPIDGFVSLDGAKGVPADVGTDVPTDSIEALYKERSDRTSEHAWRASFSQVITRSFSFTGSRLFLNVEAALQGGSSSGPCEVRVQLLSPNHEPLDGYRFDDADPITASDPRSVVSWNGDADIGRLAGQAIKLRLYFKNCKLYSFQFRLDDAVNGAITRRLRTEMDEASQAGARARDTHIDITTTGRRTGLPRRIEIWFHYQDGRIFITSSPGARGWYANMKLSPGQPQLHVALQAEPDPRHLSRRYRR